MINKIWTVLAKGRGFGSREYARNVEPVAFNFDQAKGRNMLDLLNPYNDEYLRAVYAEVLTKFLILSTQAETARAFDPVNTYSRSTMVYPTSGGVLVPVSLPTDLTIHTSPDEDEFRSSGIGHASAQCVVSTGGNTLEADGILHTYSVSNGLSSAIEIFPGISIYMRSDFTAPIYTFVYQYTVPAVVDFGTIWDRVETSIPAWSRDELSRIWMMDPRWEARLAAYIMSVVELFANG